MAGRLNSAVPTRGVGGPLSNHCSALQRSEFQQAVANGVQVLALLQSLAANTFSVFSNPGSYPTLWGVYKQA
jgi:hypothetical protein